MMKYIKLLPVLALAIFVASCASVNVVSDYDKEASFNTYKTFAFYKPGIDKAEISDLDKKRILRAIDSELSARGFQKSESPDLLINIFTKEQKQVDVYNNNMGYGWGWSPWYWGGGYSTVSTSTQGSLYIDLIDANTNQLIWQGKGSGNLEVDNVDKKEARIREFVAEILNAYPPEMAK